MSGRLTLFFLQIAVALSGIVCCGSGVEAKMIVPCYRPTVAKAATGQTFNGKLHGQMGMRLHGCVLPGL